MAKVLANIKSDIASLSRISVLKGSIFGKLLLRLAQQILRGPFS